MHRTKVNVRGRAVFLDPFQEPLTFPPLDHGRRPIGPVGEQVVDQALFLVRLVNGVIYVRVIPLSPYLVIYLTRRM
jgi:hypothetical protein